LSRWGGGFYLHNLRSIHEQEGAEIEICQVKENQQKTFKHT